MKKYTKICSSIFIVLAILIVIILLLCALSLFLISIRIDQVQESKNNEFLKKHGEWICDLECDKSLEFARVKFNGYYQVVFEYQGKEDNWQNYLKMTLEAFHYMHEESIKCGSSDLEYIGIEIIFNEGYYIKVDNNSSTDLIRVFTNFDDVKENDCNKIIDEEYSLYCR